MKLHRNLLFAGILAFGVAACGDDVTVVEPTPPPPPALQVQLTPSNAAVNAGEVADFAVGVSGGQIGASASWTCASSNTSVATVAQTATGCRATGVANGNASITATVTKGGESSSAGAQISVRQVEPATVSIFAVNQMGAPANINNIAGQVDVIVNVDRMDERPTSVELLVGDQVVATQTFAAAAPIEGDDAAAKAVQQVTLSFNTALYTIQGGNALVSHQNGQKQIRARLTGVGQGGTATRASNVITLRFNNADGLHISQMFSNPMATALDAAGLLWRGGPNFGTVDITAIPVMYSNDSNGNANTVSSVTMAAFCGQAGSTDTSAPFTFTRTCAPAGGFESGVAGVTPAFTTVRADGNNGPAGALGVFTNANHDQNEPIIWPERIDTAAPAGGALVFATQGNLNNRESWGAANYALVTGYTAPVDAAGVGLPLPAGSERSFRIRTGTTVVAGQDFSDNPLTIAGVANSINNTTYNAQAQVCDRLLNCRTITMAPNAGHAAVNPAATSHFAAVGTTGTFGKDDERPVISRGNVGAGAITTAQNTINVVGAQNYETQATDVISGFAAPGISLADNAMQHALVQVLGTANSPTLTRNALVQGGLASPQTSTTPFTTSTDGSFIVTGGTGAAAGTQNSLRYATYAQTPTSISTQPAAGSVAVPAGFGYYIYQSQVQDKAGNLSDVLTWQTYVSNNSVPALTGLVAPGTFNGGLTAVFPATSQDNVEVHQGSFDIQYPGIGNLVYERPAPTAATLFDNTISLPNSFNFEAPGFIRAIQGVSAAPAHAPTGAPIQPNLITGRVYNGLNTSLAAAAQQNHRGSVGGVGAAADANTGTSAHVAAGILSTQVQIGRNFASTTAANYPAPIAVNNWLVVSASHAAIGGTATTATVTFRIRARGASGTFENPFFQGGADGLSLVERFAPVPYLQPVTTTFTRQFTHPFPTADNGVLRDFEWTFTVTRPVGSVFNFHVLGLNSGFDALATRHTTVTFPAAGAAANAALGVVYN